MSKNGQSNSNANTGSSNSSETDAQRDVAADVAARLRRDGVSLTGQETPEELVQLLEAVERFEGVVGRAGGDLMMDEPIGNKAPIAPDDKAFVLPARSGQESIADYIGRIAEAAAGAKKHRS